MLVDSIKTLVDTTVKEVSSIDSKSNSSHRERLVDFSICFALYMC